MDKGILGSVMACERTKLESIQPISRATYNGSPMCFLKIT
jgi:hypothetical protein